MSYNPQKVGNLLCDLLIRFCESGVKAGQKISILEKRFYRMTSNDRSLLTELLDDGGFLVLQVKASYVFVKRLFIGLIVFVFMSCR